jgi:spore maturation protein CgeB
MRIFQVIPLSGTIPSAQATEIWKYNLHDPLIALGHDVVLFDEEHIDQYFLHAESDLWLKQHRDALTDKILSRFNAENEKKKIDLCFFYLPDKSIDYSILREMQEKGSLVVNYSCNNVHQFHLVQEISTHVDFAIHSESNVRNKFIAIGARPVHMQMAANPEFYKRQNLDFAFDVSFVGQRYADRGQLFVSLIQEGFDAHAFGPRWSEREESVGNTALTEKLDKLVSITFRNGLTYGLNFIKNYLSEKKKISAENLQLMGRAHSQVSDAEMVRIYNTTKINLGFSSVFEHGRAGGKVDQHVRLRDFEIPMSGGFYLTGYSTEISEYFKAGEEIEVYSTKEELISKIRYYIKNESRRRKIQEAGYRRALKDHQWKNRFEKLFLDIGLTKR